MKFTALYWRFGRLESEAFDRMEDAESFLEAAEDHGEVYADRIEGGGGTVVRKWEADPFKHGV